MIYRVEMTKQAQTDVRGIYEYIALTLLAPENASGQLDRIEKAVLSLEEMPMRYREYDTEPWKSRGLRVMPVDNFVVLYIPDRETGFVHIIRVLYSGRNIDEQMKKTVD